MRISDWSSDVCSSDLLTAYGFFRDFSLDLQLPGVSYCSLTIERLPTSEVLDDATLDPAPAGQASTLKVIQSTPVTGGLLLSSRSEEHTSELQSLMRISSDAFCLQNTNTKQEITNTTLKHSTLK